jgi:TetR/AcrR family transcriptional regulator
MTRIDDRATPTPRQEEIIDRTLELVRVGGLGGLTTRKIAARVGFTEAALFRHYPSKQALLLGLMDRLEEMLVTPIRAIADDEALPPAERLERIIRHHTTVVRQHDSLPIMLLAEASASGDPALVDRMRTIFRRYLSLLERVAREGQARGELIGDVEPDCMALLLLGAPAALAIRHRLEPDTSAEDRFEANLIPFLRAVIDPGKGRPK